ncbi:synaptic vesicle glycoprotein 2B-like isoform X2 [Daktulosphaira vitifoliae]|uniref:synaptic vesicle glycoprotein 2B-like isoform X2 n=1 Tax=Daktulosphaira vitifoliae TaxID=58002 RepID=UPI0021AB043D|nr:synaptic vesicle glycoprotein 2B-like isoform X2 [Daktulosphaira vitifoliae]
MTNCNMIVAKSETIGHENQPMDLDTAIDLVGFGKFQYYTLFICGSLFMIFAISVTSVTFILPSAQCDFEMNSTHKGLLNGASMVGMVIGSFIWGYLADSKGRRYTLIVSTMMDGIFSIVSSVVQVYPLFFFCRFMSGFGVSGVTVLYSYLGEFVKAKYREKFLCWMEIFWTAGIIILPCLAWLVIPLTFRFENEYILFKSWNLFAIVCALPSIIIATLLIKMPESPKFLLNKGKHDETIECLKVVYSWNNTTGLHEFPVKSLIMPDYTDETSSHFLKGLWRSIIGLFYSKYKIEAIVTCIIQFCATASYYMLVMWFPELMNRFRKYETEMPNSHGVSMCEIISMFNNRTEQNFIECNDNIDQSVYINIVIIGLACIPTSLALPMFVNKLGLRFFLIFSFVGSGIAAACLYYITTSTQNLVLSSIFEALSSMGISLMYCISVELFPTEHRGMAVSLGGTFGKIGALLGNIVVGIFIDAHCIIPIIIACSFLLLSAFLILTLPKTGNIDLK